MGVPDSAAGPAAPTRSTGTTTAPERQEWERQARGSTSSPTQSFDASRNTAEPRTAVLRHSDAMRWRNPTVGRDGAGSHERPTHAGRSAQRATPSHGHANRGTSRTGAEFVAIACESCNRQNGLTNRASRTQRYDGVR